MEKQLKFQSRLRCVHDGVEYVFVSNELLIPLVDAPSPKILNLKFKFSGKPIRSYYCAESKPCHCKPCKKVKLNEPISCPHKTAVVACNFKCCARKVKPHGGENRCYKNNKAKQC